MMSRTANPTDIAELLRVINAAFSVERFFLDRDRIDADTLTNLMSKGRFLIAEDGGSITACIYVEVRGEEGYFGLLSVDPARQGGGLGKKMVIEAESYFKVSGCKTSTMRIVNLRTELPVFYAKLGYLVTGTEAFSGPVVPLQECHFINYAKSL